MRLALAVTLLVVPAGASELVLREIPTNVVPGPAEYAALLPGGYAEAQAPFPLLFYLHGGGGSRDALKQAKALFDELWKNGQLPPLVAVTPSAGRSFYMDYKDRSQKWEHFILGPFLDHLRETYKVRRDRQGTLLFGISMGGMGALRLGFKHPEKFGGLAALEPGVDPALKWKEVLPRNRFWRSPELMESIFGKPFDEAYWEANNPASIAAANPARLRTAGLAIYVECGDEDSFNLHEATEFLHQVLWKHNIPHEYHLVRGADHAGRTLRPRSIEGLEFLARVINPPPPDPAVEALRKRLAPLLDKLPRR